MKLFKKLTIYTLLIIGIISCDPTKKTIENPETPETSISDTPKLVIVLSVDQLRFDYFTRFNEHFKGGLKRFWEEGKVFSNAHHYHSHTATGPGHATIGTGCYPSNNGIVGNEYYIPSEDKTIYCVDDKSLNTIGVDSDGNLKGKSPKNLKKPTLGDWMKTANPKSKVFGVAFKDRSAILMAGKNADRAFWFDNVSTKFVSSDYYKGSYPGWANAFVGKENFKAEIEKGWHKKLPESAYSTCSPDDTENEAASFQATFPHTVQSLPPTLQAKPENVPATMLWQTPYGDAYALEFAKALITKEKLGQDDAPDALMIGCSTADAIGHHFGPLSQEVQDYYLHLDEYLADFFQFLDSSIGSDNYIIVLSSDHGVALKPELAAAQGKDAKRIPKEEYHYFINDAAKKAAKSMNLKGDLVAHIGYDDLSLNYQEAWENDISTEKVQRRVAEALRQVDFVEDVYTKADLEGDADRPYLDFARNSYYPGLGGEMKMRFKEGYLLGYRTNGSSHGSPYPYDTHVPIIFLGDGIPSGQVSDRVYTVDLVPTVAKMLGVKPTEEIDGKVIFERLMN